MARIGHLFLATSFASVIAWVSVAELEPASPGSQPLTIPSSAELPSSSVVWEWKIPDGSWASPCVLVEHQLLCPVMREAPGGGACSLVALDPQTGRVQWQAELGRGSVEPWSMAVFANSVVVVGTGHHLFALALKDGSPVWQKAIRAVAVFPVADNALAHQRGMSGAPDTLVLLDPFSGAVRSSRSFENFVDTLRPWDGDMVVVSFGFEEALPPVLPFVVRLKAEDLRTLWRLELPGLKDCIVLPPDLWVYLEKQNHTGWYRLQSDGNLEPLAALAHWNGSLLWAQGEYQLWESEEGSRLCRWRSETATWAWCRDLPRGKWLAQQLDGKQVALAGSTTEEDQLFVLNDAGDVVAKASGIPDAKAFFHFQGHWLWQQEHRILLTGAALKASSPPHDVKTQAAQLLEQAAQIPHFSPLAVPRVGPLVKALLALGPDIKPVVQAKLSTSGPVGFVAAATALMAWGDPHPADLLIHWFEEQRKTDDGSSWAGDLVVGAFRSAGSDCKQVEPLARLLSAEGAPWMVRLEAFASLAQCGSLPALERLQRWLQQQEPTRGSSWFQPNTLSPKVPSSQEAWRILWNSREFIVFPAWYLGPTRGLWIAEVGSKQHSKPWYTGLSDFNPATDTLDFEIAPEGFRIILKHNTTGSVSTPQANVDKTLSISWAEIQQDRDDDGLTDLVEIRLGLSPDQADTDRDGIPDGLDWCPTCGQPPRAAEDFAAEALLYQFFAMFEPKGIWPPVTVAWTKPLEFSHPRRAVLVIPTDQQQTRRPGADGESIESVAGVRLRLVTASQKPRGWPDDLSPNPGEVAIELQVGDGLGVAAIMGKAADGHWYIVRWRRLWWDNC